MLKWNFYANNYIMHCNKECTLQYIGLILFLHSALLIMDNYNYNNNYYYYTYTRKICLQSKYHLTKCSSVSYPHDTTSYQHARDCWCWNTLNFSNGVLLTRMWAIIIIIKNTPSYKQLCKPLFFSLIMCNGLMAFYSY